MKNFFELFFYKSVNSTNDKLKELKSINDKNIVYFLKLSKKVGGDPVIHGSVKMVISHVLFLSIKSCRSPN